HNDGIQHFGDDTIGDGDLTPGMNASVTESPTTDRRGFLNISVDYAKSYANWVKVRLQVSIASGSTESTAYTDVILQATSRDLTTAESNLPPVPVSPFGVAADCSVPN
ncbi:MAG: Ig-like group 1 domain-containing protein, partial [Quisquiliibacterium sp.]